MGIKNLKAILLLKHRLRILDSAQRTKELYVDFFGLFMAIAYSVSSTEMLHAIIRDKFKFMTSIADKVILFVDRGSIALKASLREKRKQLLSNQYQRKKEEIKSLEFAINNLSMSDDLYEEQRENISSKIDKNTYYMFLYDKKNIESIVSNILSSLSNVEIHYCDHIDAEFVMCSKAREYYMSNGTWPAILSSDQDTICLLCVDRENKILYDAKMAYMLSPNKYTLYLAKLILLVNGCDFFKGLYGISINKDNYLKYAMFTDFTKDNVLRSLVYKNYSLDSVSEEDRMNDIDRVFEFINLYTSLDERAYKVQKLPDISIKSFLRTMIKYKWLEAKDKYDLTPNVLRTIYNIYNKYGRDTQNVSRDAEIMKMIEYYEYRPITKKIVQSFVSRMGIKCIDTIALLAISSSGELYLGFEGKFYFNNTTIIENSSKMLNIDLDIKI